MQPRESQVADALCAHPLPGAAEDMLGKRKRSGRPVLGGKGGSWDALVQCILADAHTPKPKNGLPGIPHAVRALIAHLKLVWSNYVPHVDVTLAPTDFRWMATAQDGILAALRKDSKLKADTAHDMLKALHDACTYLRDRVNGEWIAWADAPRELYTDAVLQAYKEAVEDTKGKMLAPPPSFLRHMITFDDMCAMQTFLHAMRTEGAANPDTLRMLGWAEVVLACWIPEDKGDIPLAMRAAMVTPNTDILNSMTIARANEPNVGSMADPTVPALPTLIETVSASEDGVQHLEIVSGHGKLRMPLEGKFKAIMRWALAQRAHAPSGERLLPRRLNSDTILRRVSRTVLSKYLGEDRILSTAILRSAWVTHHCAAVLSALETALPLDCVDSPLHILSHGLIPSHAHGIRPLLMPFQPTAADFVMAVTTGTQEQESDDESEHDKEAEQGTHDTPDEASAERPSKMRRQSD